MPGSKDEGHESSLTPPTEEEEAARHEGRDATMAEAQQRCDRLSARRIPTGWPRGAGILMVPNAETGDFDVRVVPGPTLEQLDQVMIDSLRNDDGLRVCRATLTCACVLTFARRHLGLLDHISFACLLAAC